MNQQNQPLSEGDKRKLESEIAKNEAEKKKLDLEAKEVEKRLGQRWCSPTVLAKWLVGGIVTAILITAWITTQFKPVLSRKLDILNLDSRIKLLEIEFAAKEIEAQNSALTENLAEAEERAKALRADFERLQAEYEALAQNQAVQPDKRTEFAELSKKTQKEVKSLDVDIQKLQKTRRQVDLRAKTIRPIDQRFQPIPVERDS